MSDWRIGIYGFDATFKRPIEAPTGLSVSPALAGKSTGAFTINITKEPAVHALLDDGAYFIVAVRGSSYVAEVFEIATYDATYPDVGDATGTATLVEAAWNRLDGRLFGKSVDGAGKGVGYTRGTPAATVDKGTIAREIIDFVQTAPEGGDLGIRTNPAWIAATSATWLDQWYFKPAQEALDELSKTLDGFDFRFVPSVPAVDGSGVKIAEFHVYSARGATQPLAIFEHGDGKLNVASARKATQNFPGLLTRAWALPNGFPDAAAETATAGVYQAPIASSVDATAEAKWKRREGVVSTDLASDDFRTTLVEEHARVRKTPRTLYTFEPAEPFEYRFGVDFDVGDIVTFRSRPIGVDGTMRVYAAGFLIGDDGEESVSLTLTPDV